MHIVSNIEAQLKNKKDSTDVLFSGFPAGTVTGAPKIRAIEIIEKLEKVEEISMLDQLDIYQTMEI